MDTFIHTSKLQKKYNIHNHYIKFILIRNKKRGRPLLSGKLYRVNETEDTRLGLDVYMFTGLVITPVSFSPLQPCREFSLNKNPPTYKTEGFLKSLTIKIKHKNRTKNTYFLRDQTTEQDHHQ
jgi:hypothetical protein